MNGTPAAAETLISQGGVLGAVLVILFGFIAIILFRYYLPAQHAVQVERTRLESENQKQRDVYNQTQIQQLLKIMEEQQQRFDNQLSVMREEHGKAYTMQRDFFQTEAQAQRLHVERTLNSVCESIDGLKRVVERNFVVSLVAAETSGRSKEELLERVESMVPDPEESSGDLKRRYETKDNLKGYKQR